MRLGYVSYLSEAVAREIFDEQWEDMGGSMTSTNKAWLQQTKWEMHHGKQKQRLSSVMPKTSFSTSCAMPKPSRYAMARLYLAHAKRNSKPTKKTKSDLKKTRSGQPNVAQSQNLGLSNPPRLALHLQSLLRVTSLWMPWQSWSCLVMQPGLRGIRFPHWDWSAPWMSKILSLKMPHHMFLLISWAFTSSTKLHMYRKGGAPSAARNASFLPSHSTTY